MLARDTSPDAERLQVALWRRMSPLDKCRLVAEMTRSVESLSLTGIQRRHPDASERECLLRLAVLKLGPALTRVVYPEAASRPDPLA